MSARPTLFSPPYLVVGLARSGAAVARLLRHYGEVIGCDAGSPPQAQELSGVEVHLADDGEGLLDRVQTVVKSPGVPGTEPAIAGARERGLTVAGELEVAWRLLENPFVAVTGTNGKTTTVELLGSIHSHAGVDAMVCGNVGRPVSELVGRIDKETVIICETSSFQLEDSLAFAPDCGLLLNIAPDHLDRHGSFAAYRAAKLSMFARQGTADLAVVPSGLDPPGEGRVVSFGADQADLALEDGALTWHGTQIVDTARIRLRGAHNVENAMGAAAVALARGIEPAAVAESLEHFEGVSHRLEEVTRRRGVLFVNDSKATNVASARVGIEAFEGGVHAILGGSLKGESFAGLRPAVSKRCRGCYLIGQATDQLADALEGTVDLYRCEDLERAVAKAFANAEAGEVVLLSPACASYDQYAHFEERGDHFRRLALSA